MQFYDLLAVDSDLMSGVKKIFGSEEKKELVDPYFVFSFAGQEVISRCGFWSFNAYSLKSKWSGHMGYLFQQQHRGRVKLLSILLQVKSKIMYNNDHPEFNQEMKLGLRVCCTYLIYLIYLRKDEENVIRAL